MDPWASIQLNEPSTNTNNAWSFPNQPTHTNLQSFNTYSNTGMSSLSSPSPTINTGMGGLYGKNDDPFAEIESLGLGNTGNTGGLGKNNYIDTNSNINSFSLPSQQQTGYFNQSSSFSNNLNMNNNVNMNMGLNTGINTGMNTGLNMGMGMNIGMNNGTNMSMGFGDNSYNTQNNSFSLDLGGFNQTNPKGNTNSANSFDLI